ncbi:OsmC family protein [Paenibacillus sp. NPDC056579]|uniref:OsmC family protein n=1 Tax=Paenibacillus sp. NPDC056579 TaxID=3345871 RepID=UPI0036CC34FB
MVISTSGSEAYITELFNGTSKIYSDVAEDKGGSGKYFRPHDLIESGYASCLNITTRMVLDSMSLSYDRVTVKVEFDRSNEEKTTFKYQIDISGSIANETREEVLKRVANCPVKKTLSKQLEFINECNII